MNNSLEVIKIDGKGNTEVSRYEYRKPDEEEINIIKTLTSFNFYLDNTLAIEKELSDKERNHFLQRTADTILIWISDLKSNESKLNQEFINDYQNLTMSLWSFYKRVLELKNNNKKIPKGRKPSILKKSFSSCINLSEEKYKATVYKVIKELDYKTWTEKGKDYISLIEALKKLKLLKKELNTNGKVLSEAFCNEFEIEHNTRFYRRKEDVDIKNKFINRLDALGISYKRFKL